MVSKFTNPGNSLQQLSPYSDRSTWGCSDASASRKGEVWLGGMAHAFQGTSEPRLGLALPLRAIRIRRARSFGT